jgi:drug/metabolite transporter (DMT)-like permease
LRGTDQFVVATSFIPQPRESFFGNLHRFATPDITQSFVVLVWGSNFAVVKASLTQMAPLPFAAIRFALATGLLMALLRWREGDCWFPPGTGRQFLLLGVVGNTLYQVLFCLGIFRTTSANASLIMTTTPVVVALGAGLAGLERITRNIVLGLALAFGGIVAVMAMRGAALSSETLAGDLLVLASVVCWSVYVLGMRTVGGGMSSLRATTLTLMTGAPGLLIAGLPDMLAADWHRVGDVAIFGILYSSVVSLVICYLLYNRNVRQIGGVRTTIYGCIIPVIAALVAWPVLGERPTWPQALGAALIVAGVLVTRRN